MWAVNKLRSGDVGAVLDKYSYNNLQSIGRTQAEVIFREHILPVFISSTGVKESTNIGTTQDTFGSKGYAFFMNLTSPQSSTSILMVILKENGQIVIGGLAQKDTY